MTYKNYEIQILGCIKINQNIIDDYQLTESLFFNSIHKSIFNIMKKIHEQGRKIDPLLVYEEMKDTDLSIAYYDKIDAFTEANVQFYIEEQKELFKIEKLRLLNLYIADWLKEKESTEIIQNIDKHITSLNNFDSDNLVSISDCIIPALDKIEEAYKNGGIVKGVLSGFDSLDNVTNGFMKQHLIVIAARPSVGKTAFSWRMAINMAKNKIKVAFFELESPNLSLTIRALAMESKINLSNLVSAKLKPSDHAKLADASNLLYGLPLYVDDTPNQSIIRLKSQLRRVKRRGCQIAFIDHLTKINWSELKLPKDQAVGMLSSILKDMARELDMPIILLSQIKRETEGKRPTLDMLRWSGEIEENADIVMFLHRSRENTFENSDIETELIIAKQREGAIGTINLMFESQYVLFRELNSFEKPGSGFDKDDLL